MRGTSEVISAVSLAAVSWSLWRVGKAMALIFSLGSHQPMPPSPAWYAGGVLLFLGAHEFGHWRTAKRLGAYPGWPIFFPWPLSVAAWVGWAWLPAFGTLGAWLRIRGYTRLSGSSQWRIAVAGPLAGLAVSVVLLAVGVALSAPVPTGRHIWSKLPVPLLVNALVPDGILWHPLIMAGWLGVLVTGLNLLPFPGLDGWTLWSRWAFLTGWQRACTVLSGGMVCACLPWF